MLAERSQPQGETRVGDQTPDNWQPPGILVPQARGTLVNSGRTYAPGRRDFRHAG